MGLENEPADQRKARVPTALELLAKIVEGVSGSGASGGIKPHATDLSPVILKPTPWHEEKVKKGDEEGNKDNKTG